MMKMRGKRVELVTEAAKELTWEQNISLLSDSLWIVAEQHRRLARLRGQVDFVVTDSPLLLALAYTDARYAAPWFEHAVTALWAGYDNANFFVKRSRPYEQYGRLQSEAEALDKDVAIIQLLHMHAYEDVIGDEEAAASIYRSVFPTEDLEQ